MYPKPVSVAVGSYGWVCFLCNYDETNGKSDLIKARLHSPLDKFVVVKKQVLAKEVHFRDGIVYLCADDSQITIVDEEGKVDLNVGRIKSKAMATEKVVAFGLPVQATVAQMKESLIQHKHSVQKQYTESDFERSTINFWCSDSCDQPKFSSVCIVDNELLYAAFTTEKAIVAVTTSLDGVGMRGSVQRLFSYGEHWRAVSSLCIVSGKMFAVSTLGIEMIDLENAVHSIRVVDNARGGLHPLQVRKRGPDIIFSDPTNRKIYRYIIRSATLKDFAGSGNENSVDGPVAQCCFRQPCGIDVEFDNVVYPTDAMSGTVNVISPLNNTVKFLKAVGDLYKGFSVHDKGKTYETFNLPIALGLIHNCRALLEENERAIYHDVNTDLPKT